jgi:pimeloyl-ACP methyl ester carboxylesterase
MKPVVFIPGFPASELWRVSPRRMLFPPGLDDIGTPNKREKLIGELTDVTPPQKIVAGQPIRRVMLIAKQAESLYDLLRSRFGYTIEAGNNFRAVGWDWRLGIDDAAVQSAIRSAITELRQATNEKVVVILHSTGGVVFRALLEADTSLHAEIDSILAIGVPWAGTLKALRYLTDGEPMGFLTAKLSAAQTRRIIRAAQAAYDLCPPDPSKTDLTTADGAPFKLVQNASKRSIAPLTTVAWMGNDAEVQQRGILADQRLGTRTWTLNAPLTITNLAGWGLTTDTLCTITNNGVTYDATSEGDSTVPYVSATWLRGPRVRTLSVPIGVTITDQIPDPHSQLWSSEPIAQALREVLGGAPEAPFVHASVDNDTSLDPQVPVLVRVTASQADGSPLPGASVTLHLAKNQNRTKPLAGTRLDWRFARTQGMKANFGSRYFRFRIDVDWNGGRKELPLMIRI